MAKTQKRRAAAPTRRTPANSSAEWQRRELKRQLRTEREIVRLIGQVQHARSRSETRLLQFAQNVLQDHGFTVVLPERQDAAGAGGR